MLANALSTACRSAKLGLPSCRDQLLGLRIRLRVAPFLRRRRRAGPRQWSAAGNQRHTSEPDEDRKGEGTGPGFGLRKEHRAYHSFRERGNLGRNHTCSRRFTGRKQTCRLDHGRHQSGRGAVRLDEEGIRPKRGKRWIHTTVKTILARNAA